MTTLVATTAVMFNRTIALCLGVLLLVAAGAAAQEPEAPEGTLIGSAQVNGLDPDRLSPGLQRDIDALVGRSLSREYLNELATRIEGERPEVVAAVRTVVGPDGNARVVFFVARISDDQNLTANINARYIVESVSVEGIAESKLSSTLRADMQLMVGTRLDNEAAQQIVKRVEAELPGYEVARRISKGAKPGQIKLTFDVEKGEALRWLHFAPNDSKFLYHSDEGWGGVLDLGIQFERTVRATVGFAIDNADDLVEEYSGYFFGLESRQVGSERLGLGIELSRFHQDWRDQTLAAVVLDPSLPELYDERTTVAPWATFAITPRLRASAGVSISELEPLTGFDASQSANAFVASIGYDQEWRRGPRSSDTGAVPSVGSLVRQNLAAEFSDRAGVDALESDLVYKRYFGNGNYRVSWRQQDLLISGLAGGLTGQAPMFERFTLGDSSTLRGWDRYDIAPAGGDRVLHSSVEYRNHGLAFFVDAGAVWDHGTDAATRVSTGFGFHDDNFFATLAFPLNTDDVRAVFMIGVRAGPRWQR